jgi:hypothetical protein
MRKYTLNDDYFENINTEDKAYFLGFIAADGNVTERYKNCRIVKIDIHKQDVIILEKFKKCINFEGDIIYHTSRKNMCSITCTSVKMFNDLSKYGIVPRKTKILEFPNIPDELIHHYMRGYFDGDGCISIHKENRVGRGSDRGQVNIVSGSYKFIEKYVDILIDKTNIKRNKIMDRNTNGRYFVIDWGGLSDVEKIYNFLYKDAKTYLNRKKDKYDEVMKLNSKTTKYRKR